MVSPSHLRAQSNPPFQSPALDSNCYFPQIGDPTEMDTIVGSTYADPNTQWLGTIVKNMGTKYGGGFGNMFIGDISPSVALAQVGTGPSFNLHRMAPFIQKITPNDVQGDVGFWRLGHFRDQGHLDIFVGANNGAGSYGWIFWADDEGNYDSTRFTVLIPNIRKGNFVSNGGIGNGPIQPYIAHLTSDTADDIVISAYTADFDTVFPFTDYDTAYVLLYRGGSQLYGKDTVYEDTSAYLYPAGGKSSDFRSCTQADFRGVGRDDVIVIGKDMCYYKNDPPFSLEKFAQDIAHDTLYAFWQDPVVYENNTTTFLTMRAVPKSPGDKSVDFVPVFDNIIYPGPVIFIFRGGPDFGSHRITFDSAAFVITNPFNSNYLWPYNVADAGDMTGTGNRVLYTAGAWSNDNQTDNFYVTGKALDNKIDIYNVSNSGGRGDTLTANDDSLEDFLLSRPYGNGTLWLYYGSKNIPVHLNPQWADVKTEIEKIPQQNGAGVTLSPNPANSWTVATIVWPEAEEGEYIITDMLGREVQRDQIQFLGGGQENRISFPELPQGAYAFTLIGQHGTATARLIKLAAANAPAAAGTRGSFMQSLRDGRDGKASKFPEARSLIR
jgi:hypothetical protein